MGGGNRGEDVGERGYMAGKGDRLSKLLLVGFASKAAGCPSLRAPNFPWCPGAGPKLSFSSPALVSEVEFI